MSVLMNGACNKDVAPAWWPFKTHCHWHANLCNWVTRQQEREREKRTSSSCYCFHFHISCFFIFVFVVIYVFISFFFLCLLLLFSCLFPLLSLSSLYFEWAIRKLHQGELFTFPLRPLKLPPSLAFAVAPNLRIPFTFELSSDCAAAASTL